MHGISDLQRCEQVTGFGDGFLEFPLGCSFRGISCDGLVREFFFLFIYFFSLAFFFFGLFPELLSLDILHLSGS